MTSSIRSNGVGIIENCPSSWRFNDENYKISSIDHRIMVTNSRRLQINRLYTEPSCHATMQVVTLMYKPPNRTQRLLRYSSQSSLLSTHGNALLHLNYQTSDSERGMYPVSSSSLWCVVLLLSYYQTSDSEREGCTLYLLALCGTSFYY
jgi:hypothetical protein